MVDQSEWLVSERQEVAGVGEDVGKENLVPSRWGCKLVQPLSKTVWKRYLKKKLKIEVPYDPVIPLQGIYLRKMKMLI